MRRRLTVIPPADPLVIAELIDLRRAMLDEPTDDYPPLELVETPANRPRRGRDFRVTPAT